MTFAADELVIDFVDVEPARAGGWHGQAQRRHVEPDRASQWWILTPLVERWAKRPKAAEPRKFNKEPVYVEASRGVVGVFTSTDATTGRIKNRFAIASEKLTADLRGELLTIPTRGTLLIEDYRPPSSPDVSRQGVDALFGRGGNLPSQTYISWSGLLSYHAARYHADFRDDVLLINRRGSEMALAEDLLGHYQSTPELSAGPGRQTRLQCGALMVEFAGNAKPTDGNPSEAAGIGGMSVRDIRQLEATGGVLLVDDEYSVEAFRIVKYDGSDLLRIYGSDGQEAEIYSDQPHGPRLRGPEFSYNLVTGRIDAPHLQSRSRR